MKRSRGRGRRPQGNTHNTHHNNHNRSFDSTGPDVKIRGTAASVYEKYLQLARDASSSGDRVLQENYLQHAEHYYRTLMAQGGQLPQAQPQPYQGQPMPNGSGNGAGNGEGSANGNGNGNGDGRPVEGEGGYTQPVAGSTPSFSLADADMGEEVDDMP